MTDPNEELAEKLTQLEFAQEARDRAARYEAQLKREIARMQADNGNA